MLNLQQTRIFSFVMLLLLFGGCAKRPKQSNGKQLMPGKFAEVHLPGIHDSATSVLYTGCGGMVITHRGEALMTDPFYTGQHLFQIPGRIRIDSARSNRIIDSIRLKLIDPSNIRAVLIAHAHYDHMLELPYLLRYNILNDSIRIIGNSSAHCNIQSFLKPTQSFIESTGIWENISPHIRVMAIKSSHAPHFRHKMFMEGNSCPQGVSGLDTPFSKTSGFSWKDGGTLSFLVDLLDEAGKPQTRLFIQSSASEAPDGFPPAAVISEKAVDIAFLCVASFKNVDRYPEQILNYIHPTQVVLIHWEDFFRQNFIDQPRIIRMSNTKKLIHRLLTYYHLENQSLLANKVIMPAPFTLIKIR